MKYQCRTRERQIGSLKGLADGGEPDTEGIEGEIDKKGGQMAGVSNVSFREPDGC